jgi:predicted HicB family RNase H-like nuclease
MSSRGLSQTATNSLLQNLQNYVDYTYLHMLKCKYVIYETEVMLMGEGKKTFHTNIDIDLIKKLKIEAARQEKRVNELLEEILTEYFEKH